MISCREIVAVILIIIVLHIIFVDNSDIYEHYNAEKEDLKNYYAYRLADIVRRLSAHKVSRDYLDRHKGTIGEEYSNRTKMRNDYKMLKSICDERKSGLKEVPKDNELIMHMRLGDVIEKSRYSVDEHLAKRLKSHGDGSISTYRVYVQAMDFYNDYILNEIKGTNVDTIVFVGGDHRDLDSLNKTHDYLNKVSKMFEENGYKTRIKFNDQSADEDFVYITSAKHFAPTGGGFGRLAIGVVELNGGIVYDKYFDKCKDCFDYHE